MRISDWSSDLCSSDLLNIVVEFLVEARRGEGTRLAEIILERQVSLIGGDRLEPRIAGLGGILPVIGDRIAVLVARDIGIRSIVEVRSQPVHRQEFKAHVDIGKGTRAPIENTRTQLHDTV